VGLLNAMQPTYHAATAARSATDPPSEVVICVVKRRYNKRRDDFNTKEEWDDYLEMVEDLSESWAINQTVLGMTGRRNAQPSLPSPPSPAVFNLVNRVDVPETEARISEYERGNRLAIISNQARMVSPDTCRSRGRIHSVCFASLGITMRSCGDGRGRKGSMRKGGLTRAAAAQT
jgi:hypothetical protein